MKRSHWLLIPLVPLLLTSCDRKTAAHLFLHIGFNAPSGETLPTAVSEVPVTEPGVAASFADLESALDEMRQLQRESNHPEDLRNDATKVLIEQITALTESLDEQETTGETEAALVRETKWIALSVGAEVFPETYGHIHDTYQGQLFGRSTTAEEAGAESAKRFIRQYLVRLGGRDEAVRALSFHSLLYPDCEMNVDLYVTTAEQLANEQQVSAAVAVSKEGLERCAHHADVAMLREQLERIYDENHGAPGVPMNFAGPLIDGQTFDVKSTRGNPVLVVFWASWCSACRGELPVLRDLHQRYRDDGLQIVGVSLDKDRSQLTKFVGANRLNWPHVFADQPLQSGWDNPIAKYYRVNSIPRTFLLDANGVVVAADLRGDFEIETAILDLLARQ